VTRGGEGDGGEGGKGRGWLAPKPKTKLGPWAWTYHESVRVSRVSVNKVSAVVHVRVSVVYRPYGWSGVTLSVSELVETFR